MNKAFKYTLWITSIVLVIAFILGIAGWLYLNATFLDFENDYREKRTFKKMVKDGYVFVDRNDNGILDIYEDDRRTVEERAGNALSLMTIEEKIHLLKGSGIASALGRETPGKGVPGAVGTIVPTPRLGLPTVYLSDGPAGLRIEPRRKGDDKTYYCTAFPIATMLASTWNDSLVEEVGRAMGDEALAYGLDVILGPGVNIHRHPFCSRNFEYYSEDPFLTGKMGVAIVNGIESRGVGTSIKHFVANNQETNRYHNNAIISDRALREIYLKGFEIIVREAHPWTIMSSYNKVNGLYTSESKVLLTDILRNEWGFRGVVMSDWFACGSAPAKIMAGNDLLEPGTRKQWKRLTKAYKEGTLTIDAIDTSTKRILELIFASRKMGDQKISNAPDLGAHAEVARKAASEGIVLLKNIDALPLNAGTQVALLGVTSFDLYSGGTGSGDVNEAYVVSLDEGLINEGFVINTTAQNIFEIHKKKKSKAFKKPAGIRAMYSPYDPPEIHYSPGQLEQLAAEADIAILAIGRNSGEGGERRAQGDFLLTATEMELIEHTCRAFHERDKKVVVILNIGGVIETASWQSFPDAILLAWQGGQEGGNAVVDVLSGKINPSGKLPMTFPNRVQDHATHENFPLDGKPIKITDILYDRSGSLEKDTIRNWDYTNYEEGIYVGYRHFDKAGIEVSYPFGFGLSYTEFEYSKLNIDLEEDSILVSLFVQNTGTFSGKEVIQVYVSKHNSKVDRPGQELKAFIKTHKLEPGETTQLNLAIPMTDLAYWDEVNADWHVEDGSHAIYLGSSSRDIRLSGSVNIE